MSCQSNLAAWPEPPLTPPEPVHATLWERIHASKKAKHTHIARAQIIDVLMGKRDAFVGFVSPHRTHEYTPGDLCSDILNNVDIDIEARLLALLLTGDEALRKELLAQVLPALDAFVEHHANLAAERDADVEVLL